MPRKWTKRIRRSCPASTFPPTMSSTPPMRRWCRNKGSRGAHGGRQKIPLGFPPWCLPSQLRLNLKEIGADRIRVRRIGLNPLHFLGRGEVGLEAGRVVVAILGDFKPVEVIE